MHAAFSAVIPITRRRGAELPLNLVERVTFKKGFHSTASSGLRFFECPKRSNQEKCTPALRLARYAGA